MTSVAEYKRNKQHLTRPVFPQRQLNGILIPSMRKPLIAANWKMYKTPAEATAFLTSFYPLVKQNTVAEILICPSMTSLPALVDAARSKPVAIGAHARHKNITMQIGSAGARRGFHLRGGGAVLPVVHVVVDHIEALAGQRALDGVRIVAVGHDIADAFSQFVARLAMQHRDFVTSVREFLHQRLADEQSAADHQHFALGRVLAFGSVSRSTRAQGV